MVVFFLHPSSRLAEKVLQDVVSVQFGFGFSDLCKFLWTYGQLNLRVPMTVVLRLLMKLKLEVPNLSIEDLDSLICGMAKLVNQNAGRFYGHGWGGKGAVGKGLDDQKREDREKLADFWEECVVELDKRLGGNKSNLVRSNKSVLAGVLLLVDNDNNRIGPAVSRLAKRVLLRS